jgi:D-alanine-D-alanine ligase
MAGQDMNRFGRVGVLCGGLSSERPISLQSGEAVLAGLLEAGVDAIKVDIGADAVDQIRSAKINRAFLVLHGPGGEDGRMQSLLEAIGIPYTGSGVAASALAMDKYRTKLMWRGAELPTATFELLGPDTKWDEIIEKLGGKVMVKPANEGSSLGMAIATSAQTLQAAYVDAATHDSIVIAERWLPGREFTVPVIGDLAYPPVEIASSHDFYDYEAKYLSDSTEYVCPVQVDEALIQEMQRVSLQAYHILGCSGWARIDLMMDEDEELMLLEVNIAPGMTSHSLVPMSAKVAGLSFSQMVVKILETSMEAGT